MTSKSDWRERELEALKRTRRDVWKEVEAMRMNRKESTPMQRGGLCIGRINELSGHIFRLKKQIKRMEKMEKEESNVG